MHQLGLGDPYQRKVRELSLGFVITINPTRQAKARDKLSNREIKMIPM